MLRSPHASDWKPKAHTMYPMTHRQKLATLFQQTSHSSTVRALL